ncbi:hypothetical protein ES703_48395 [subsurface metagenome]
MTIVGMSKPHLHIHALDKLEAKSGLFTFWSSQANEVDTLRQNDAILVASVPEKREASDRYVFLHQSTYTGTSYVIDSQVCRS